MSQVSRSIVYDWMRHDKKFPHVWCPGCGLGILLGSLVRAFVKSGLDKDEVVLVSGIGCSGRLPVYVDVSSVHTTHGRALTFARRGHILYDDAHRRGSSTVEQPLRKR